MSNMRMPGYAVLFERLNWMGLPYRTALTGFQNCLAMEEEMALIRTLSEFPSLLEDISKTLEAHRLTYYLTHLAASFHRYFNMGSKKAELRVVTEDKNLTRARLILVSGVKIVIANGLKLLGVSAPEKM